MTRAALRLQGWWLIWPRNCQWKFPDFPGVDHEGHQTFQLADGSFYAYAACSYLRLVDTDDNIFCTFVIAKSRLVPIKAVSIPRLELTAAVLAVRLNALVKGELNFDIYQSYF